jgi:hypothetical protein
MALVFCCVIALPSPLDPLALQIQSFGIVPTINFLRQMRANSHADISFKDFIRTLSNYDPSTRNIDIMEDPAGEWGE